MPQADTTVELNTETGPKPKDERRPWSPACARRPSPAAVADALSTIPVGGGPDDPDVDEDWGELGLTPAERAAPPALLPNLGGLPNDAFADELGLPTIWIPHSYPACAQHAPDEHLLAPLARQAMQLMAGLFWDLGEDPAAG